MEPFRSLPPFFSTFARDATSSRFGSGVRSSTRWAITSNCSFSPCNDGDVMMTRQTGPLVITPIFWAPAGHPMSAAYERIITNYLIEVALSSGRFSERTWADGTEYGYLLQEADGTLVGGISFTTWSSNSNSIVQLAAPDHLRGRVIGLYFFAFAGTGAVGGIMAGWLIHVGGTELAFAVAGIAALAATGIVGHLLRTERAPMHAEQPTPDSIAA